MIQSPKAPAIGNLSVGTKVTMGIDKASEAEILRSLTVMYQDPHYAVLREYCANALDSHIRAGVSRPIEVILPSDLSPELSIRDFGLGMSRDEIVAVYSKYGASTKRNDNAQVGAFGFGSKSALAVAGGFSFTAVKDGKMNRVLAAPNADGIPEFTILDEQDTDMANGVEVRVPSSPEDMGEFRRVVYTNNIFFAWPEGTVIVDGKTPRDAGKLFKKDVFTPLSDTAYLSNNAGWSSNPIAEKTTVVVGPVFYSIHRKQMAAINAMVNAKLDSKDIKLSSDLVVRVPNGSVTFVSNRDDFVYDMQTKITIVDAIVDAVKAYIASNQNKIDAAEDYLKAVSIVTNLTHASGVPFTYRGSPFGSLATVSRYHNAYDSCVIDRSTRKVKYSGHGNHSPSNVHFFVTNVPKRDKKNDYILVGISSLIEKLPDATSNVRLAIIGETTEKFDANLVGNEKVISYEDVLVYAKEIRRKKEATRRALGSKAVRNPNPKLNIASNGSFSLTEITDSFKSAHKFVTVDIKNDDYALNLIKKSNNYSTRAQNMITVAMEREGYRFVSINKTHTLEKVTSAVGSTTGFYEAIAEYLVSATATTVASEAHLAALADGSKNNKSFEVDFTVINKKSSVEWLTAYHAVNHDTIEILANVMEDNWQFRLLKAKNVKIADAIAEGSKILKNAIDSFQHPYPMLVLANGSTTSRKKSKAKLIADYINLVDSQK